MQVFLSCVKSEQFLKKQNIKWKNDEKNSFTTKSTKSRIGYKKSAIEWQEDAFDFHSTDILYTLKVERALYTKVSTSTMAGKSYKHDNLIFYISSIQNCNDLCIFIKNIKKSLSLKNKGFIFGSRYWFIDIGLRNSK